MITIQSDYAVVSFPHGLLNQQKKELEKQVKRDNPHVIYVFFRTEKEFADDMIDDEMIGEY